MIARVIVVEGPSILELLGWYPALLAVGAVLVGISTVAIRRNRYNAIACVAILSMGFFGFGATAWRMFRSYGLLREGSWADPGQFLHLYGTSWMAAGIVLPACGIGCLFLCLSMILTRTPLSER